MNSILKFMLPLMLILCTGFTRCITEHCECVCVKLPYTNFAEPAECVALPGEVAFTPDYDIFIEPPSSCLYSNRRVCPSICDDDRWECCNIGANEASCNISLSDGSKVVRGVCNGYDGCTGNEVCCYVVVCKCAINSTTIPPTTTITPSTSSPHTLDTTTMTKESATNKGTLSSTMRRSLPSSSPNIPRSPPPTTKTGVIAAPASSDGIPTGAVIGAAVGAAFILFICITLLLACKYRNKIEDRSNTSTTAYSEGYSSSRPKYPSVIQDKRRLTHANIEGGVDNSALEYDYADCRQPTLIHTSGHNNNTFTSNETYANQSVVNQRLGNN